MGATSSIMNISEGEPGSKVSFRGALQLLFSNGNRISKMSEVEKDLLRMREAEKYVHKILLLGAGEAGKSTALKQIKLLSKIKLTDSEIQEYTVNIRRNVIEAIQTLLLVGGELGEELDNSALMEDVEKILELDLYESVLTPDLAVSIHMLWEDRGIQTIYDRREQYHLMDATEYYLSEVKRIAEDDYIPTEEDTIMTRVRTTGMVTTEIQEGPFTYQIVDVGGQRSERRKWIHCFDNVRTIIFLEGLSGYCQVLFEDAKTNRMQESLRLFAEVVKNPAFKTTPIFIFLNKKDLFEDLILKHPLRKCFPDYDGAEGESLPALKCIEKHYRDIYNSYHEAAGNYNKKKQPCDRPGGLYVQVIAARVRMDMKMAFGQVKDTLKTLFPMK
jgi:GTPase SAR1 family protein